jgi:hypothetical protein
MVLRPSYAAERKKNTPSIAACLRVVHVLYSMGRGPSPSQKDGGPNLYLLTRSWVRQSAESDKSAKTHNPRKPAPNLYWFTRLVEAMNSSSPVAGPQVSHAEAAKPRTVEQRLCTQHGQSQIQSSAGTTRYYFFAQVLLLSATVCDCLRQFAHRLPRA